MKKGFTLVELIITIGLITLLGTVIVSNLGSNLVAQQEKQYDLFKETLENAACVYIDRIVAKDIKRQCKIDHSCDIPLSNLLENGLIEEKDLIDPLLEMKISDTKVVRITYTDGFKDCQYIE